MTGEDSGDPFGFGNVGGASDFEESTGFHAAEFYRFDGSCRRGLRATTAGATGEQFCEGGKFDFELGGIRHQGGGDGFVEDGAHEEVIVHRFLDDDIVAIVTADGDGGGNADGNGGGLFTDMDLGFLGENGLRSHLASFNHLKGADGAFDFPDLASETTLSLNGGEGFDLTVLGLDHFGPIGQGWVLLPQRLQGLGEVLTGVAVAVTVVGGEQVRDGCGVFAIEGDIEVGDHGGGARRGGDRRLHEAWNAATPDRESGDCCKFQKLADHHQAIPFH